MAVSTLMSSHTPTAELPRLTYPEERRGSRSKGGSKLLKGRGAVLTAAVALVALVALGAFVVHRRNERLAEPDATTVAPAILTLDDGGWRYVFHAPTGTEALYHLKDDPNCRRNVFGEQELRAIRMREKLLKDAGVDSLEELQAPHRDTIESLKSLGYL